MTKKHEDPIAAIHKKANVSPKSMFKNSMRHLFALTGDNYDEARRKLNLINAWH